MIKRLLVLGGGGQLGKAVVSTCSAIANTVSVDRIKPADQKAQFQEFKGCYSDLEARLKLRPKFDMVAVTAGGWKGGKISQPNCLQVYSELSDMIIKPSLFGCKLAGQMLNPGGMLVLVGANGVFQKPQSSMMAYSLCKAAVHGMNHSFVGQTQTNMATILFDTLDTPSNRQFLAPQTHKDFVPPRVVAEQVKGWLSGVSVPAPGSYFRIKASAGKITTQTFLP